MRAGLKLVTVDQKFESWHTNCYASKPHLGRTKGAHTLLLAFNWHCNLCSSWCYSTCNLCCSCHTRLTHKTCSHQPVTISCWNHRRRRRVIAGHAPMSRNAARFTASRTGRCGAHSASGRRRAIASRNIDWMTSTDFSAIAQPHQSLAYDVLVINSPSHPQIS